MWATLKRSPLKEGKCCAGADWECFGCNPVLLGQGQSCIYQTADSHIETESRDCACDSGCILFGDCCDDHVDTCSHLYNEDKVTPVNFDCKYLKEKSLTHSDFYYFKFWS